MEQLPNRIRELRNARGWRLEDLADRVGCSVTFVSDVERGVRELSLQWMKRFARVLKVQPADLLSETDNSRSLSPGERELAELYASADEGQRQQLLQMARLLITGSPAPTRAPRPGPRRAANA
jgi:transcriptional regulator with XRE-family HTH domain